MTQERIWRLDEDGDPTPLTETEYGDEDALQKLIAEHPDVLAGELMTPNAPRRWLLIDREVGIVGSRDAGGLWSVDLLLVDQDARPTLVEVKLANNPEIRRRIVGQMLDYAAYAPHSWTGETIRRRLEARVGGEEAARDAIERLLDSDPEPTFESPEAFWEQATKNLIEQNLRLLFVADRIPEGLATVVAFLNRHTAANVEVLAVELKQFLGTGLRTLVPRVIGMLDERRAAGGAPRRSHTQETLLTEFPEGSIREAARTLLERSEAAGAVFEFGPSGVSIRGRCPAWRSDLVTVAWLYPPDLPSLMRWMRTRDFCFGTAILDYDPPPTPEMREALWRYMQPVASESWAHEDASSKGVTAYWVAPEDAVAHIETLASRVEDVLQELAALPPTDE